MSDVREIATDYPLLWERSLAADTNERLGRSVDALDAEADAALREICDGRREVARLRDSVDLTLRCPTCGQRADMCFAHGDDWKKRPLPPIYKRTEAQLRAGVNEFTQDDPPPYVLGMCPHGVDLDREFCPQGCRV